MVPARRRSAAASMGGDKVGSEEERGRPISGYGGFVPGITAGNVFAHDYQKSLSAAQQLTADQDSTLGLANPQYKGAPPWG